MLQPPTALELVAILFPLLCCSWKYVLARLLVAHITILVGSRRDSGGQALHQTSQSLANGASVKKASTACANDSSPCAQTLLTRLSLGLARTQNRGDAFNWSDTLAPEIDRFTPKRRPASI